MFEQAISAMASVVVDPYLLGLIFATTILGVIIGGRLGYVVFYNPIYYSKNLIEIFMIWNGGMSFHGGGLGAIFATYLFSKKNNINYIL